jgi:DNA repair protein RadD
LYKKFFDSLKLKVLGLTATPVRMKRYNFPVPHAKICMLDRMRPRFFSEYLHITQISEMKENKFFAELEYFDFKFDASFLRLNSTGGDYTTHSINTSLKENSVLRQISNLFDSICTKGVIQHILIFVESIESAFDLQKMIGVNNCGVVTGQTPKGERADILKSFKEGHLKAVANVGVLTTGFDFPELDCIIGARPTMSLGLYYQIIGRCVRPHSNKQKAYVFDFVGNYRKFGKVEDLVIEKKNNLWVIHNGQTVLTNNDISGGGRDEVDKLKNAVVDLQNDLFDQGNVTIYDPVINFGKYKAQKCSEVPVSYLKWMHENFTRNKYNEQIFIYIEKNVLIQK